MALDDLMSCMARGMVLGFLALMLGVAAVGIAHHPFSTAHAAENVAVTDDSPTADISSDYVTSPGQRALDLWTREAHVDFLSHEDPLIRVLGASILDRQEAWADQHSDDPELADLHKLPESAPDWETRNEIRWAALEAGWTDPAVVYLVNLSCQNDIRIRRPAECSEIDLPKRLRALDPDNAVAHLANPGFQVGDGWTDPALMDTPANRAALRAAAEATHIDSYWPRIGPRQWRALQDYARRNPAPVVPIEDWRAALDLDSLDEVPEHLPLVMAWTHHIGYVIVMSDTSASKGYVLCRHAAETGDQELHQTCRNFGLLLRDDSNDYLSEQLGRSMVQRMDAGWADDTAFKEQRQRQSRLHWHIFECERPRWMTVDDYLMEAEDIGLITTYVEQVARLGELDGSMAAAREDFARHPERYEQDPATCRDILDASPAEQAAVIRQLELEDLDRQELMLEQYPELFE